MKDFFTDIAWTFIMIAALYGALSFGFDIMDRPGPLWHPDRHCEVGK